MGGVPGRPGQFQTQLEKKTGSYYVKSVSRCPAWDFMDFSNVALKQRLEFPQRLIHKKNFW